MPDSAPARVSLHELRIPERVIAGETRAHSGMDFLRKLSIEQTKGFGTSAEGAAQPRSSKGRENETNECMR
jgi:hypothetical protein